MFLFATFNAFDEISEIVIVEFGYSFDNVIPMTPEPVPKSNMLSFDSLSNCFITRSIINSVSCLGIKEFLSK